MSYSKQASLLAVGARFPIIPEGPDLGAAFRETAQEITHYDGWMVKVGASPTVSIT